MIREPYPSPYDEQMALLFGEEPYQETNLDHALRSLRLNRARNESELRRRRAGLEYCGGPLVHLRGWLCDV
jgi:hypothetical protein